jgi:hypothetical protein
MLPLFCSVGVAGMGSVFFANTLASIKNLKGCPAKPLRRGVKPGAWGIKNGEMGDEKGRSTPLIAAEN